MNTSKVILNVLVTLLSVGLGRALSVLTRGLFYAADGDDSWAFFGNVREHVQDNLMPASHYEGVWWLMLLYVLCSLGVTLLVLKVLPKYLLFGQLAITFGITLGVYFTSRPTPLMTIQGPVGFPKYALFYGLVMIAHIGGGVLAGLTGRINWSSLRTRKMDPYSSMPRGPRRHDLGFTMIEILVVIGIIALLAGILFPVLSRSKREAKVSVDIEKLHQTYVAICLYENDAERQSPPSLLSLIPTYAPASVLRSDLDSRQGRSAETWPANVWVINHEFDQEYSRLRSKNMISFAYLYPFNHRFQTGVTFEQLRQDPKIGLLADPAVGGCRAACVFPDSPVDEPGHPAVNVASFLVVRTDGSISKRILPSSYNNSPLGVSYEQLFLFWPFNAR